jgi:pimeloyl-ACP methyl ester carboxylesterase
MPAISTTRSPEVLRWLLRIIASIFLFIALVLLYLWWSNRDLPVAILEQQYGGENLQQALIEGVPVRYKVEGQGPALLLIHSHFYTMRLWQPWVEELSEHFTVIRYDLTSHGLTGPDPSGDYSRERGMQLILGLLDHLDITSAHIVGSSTGGALAWYTAARHPQRVNKLILLNAPGMPRITNKYMEKTLPDWFGYVFYLLPEQVFRPFLEAPVVDKSLITDELVTEFHRMYRRRGNRMAEFNRLLAWERGDVRPDLARITAPTLIMWGEQNPQLPVEHVGQYREALINAVQIEDIIYPDIGHVIPLEIPRQSALDAKAFLLEN